MTLPTDPVEDLGSGVVGTTLSLVSGLLVPFFFNALTQEQDPVLFLIVLATFAACILYGEIYITFLSGVAFGFGMLLISFAAQDLWLLGLATAAVVVNLARYARGGSGDEGSNGFDLDGVSIRNAALGGSGDVLRPDPQP